MLEKDSGVVLGATASGETSRRVVFLGRRFGKIQLMAKGALRRDSPLRGLLEPGYRVEVVF
jgi:recombinational DNA repair protein (RecF pathway)